MNEPVAVTFNRSIDLAQVITAHKAGLDVNRCLWVRWMIAARRITDEVC